MKDLKCGTRQCHYNKGYCCCSKCICVSENGECKTFENDENKHKSMFETSNEFTKANYSVDTDVSCSADCVFNKSGKCFASGITVMREPDSPASCLTFIKK